jgi:glucose/arabinose dehydrogenase
VYGPASRSVKRFGSQARAVLSIPGPVPEPGTIVGAAPIGRRWQTGRVGSKSVGSNHLGGTLMAQSARSSHRRLVGLAALLAGGLLTAGSGLASAGYEPGTIDLAFTRVASGLTRPVYVANAGDGTHRKFVVEQDGRIRVYADNWAPLGTYLDIRSRVRSPADGGDNEQGLLGLAFHPNFEGNSRFYVNYTEGDGDTVIAEYRQRSSNPNVASTGERRLLHIDQPYSNHNGGQLAFGLDGLLYIGTGDGGGSGDPGNRAQNKSSLLGKILRINPVQSGTRAYTIPSSNPFVGVTGNDLIWSYGLRNPWRFSFDRSLGDLWIGDVGQNNWEEIDWARANRTSKRNAGKGWNFAWSCREGFHTYKSCSTPPEPFRSPVAEYSHSYGCSVTGGYVYRGSKYPDMKGVYIFGDYCSGRIWALNASATTYAQQSERLLRDTGYLISSFGEDERGYLYLVNHSGEVFRLRDTTL